MLCQRHRLKMVFFRPNAKKIKGVTHKYFDVDGRYKRDLKIYAYLLTFLTQQVCDFSRIQNYILPFTITQVTEI